MLVLGGNSKRQRRPSVRLGEIGDVSAAFSCGLQQKIGGNWENKTLKHKTENTRETELHPICGFPMDSSRFAVSELGVSPRISMEMHNRENRNPNSGKAVSEFLTSAETHMNIQNLDFGKVTRKSRIMKRRTQNAKGNSILGKGWTSRINPEVSDGKGYESYRCGQQDACYDAYARNKDYSDHETLDTGKVTQENDWAEPVSGIHVWDNSGEFRAGNVCKDSKGMSYDNGHYLEGELHVVDKMTTSGTVLNTVKGWLEELGFGKYAGVFQKHEVDEQVLPFLTFEDLKEMGINAVGTRRRMFSAIQLLKEGLLHDRSGLTE